MNKNKELIKHAVIFGLMMAGAFILFDLLNYTFDFAGMGWVMSILTLFITIAILAVFYIWAGRSYRNKFGDGYLTYGRAFMICLIMVVASTLVMALYTYLFYYFFDPQRAANSAQQAIQAIQDNANIPDERKESIIKRMTEGFTPFRMVISSLTSAPIFSIVVGSIVALFMRKREKISEVF